MITKTNEVYLSTNDGGLWTDVYPGGGALDPVVRTHTQTQNMVARVTVKKYVEWNVVLI